MVPRKAARQYRVRGVDQQAGSGQQMVPYEVWISMVIEGRMVVDW